MFPAINFALLIVLGAVVFVAWDRDRRSDVVHAEIIARLRFLSDGYEPKRPSLQADGLPSGSAPLLTPSTPARAGHSWTRPTLLVVLLAGLVGFLGPMYEMVSALNEWTGPVWEQPAMAATLIRSTMSGLLAMAAAGGLSILALKR